MKNRCLYCYEPLSEGEGVDYHAKCCRKLFGTSQAPVLPYTSNEVRALAMRSFVRRPLLQEYNLSSLRVKYSGT